LSLVQADDPVLPMADPGLPCALHCAGLLLSALFIVVLPVLMTRVAQHRRGVG
jgi:hypothetical protein